MKKRFFVLLIGALSFALCACSDSVTKTTAQIEESTEQQTTTEETATQLTETEEPQATEEPEQTEEPKTTEEVATEETATPEESTTIGTTPEPTEEPEPEPQYTYTDMSATMYAKQSVNVRSLPSTDGERVGSLSTNQEIAITGQCNETGWYRFEYNGTTAYVSNNYLSDTQIEVAASAPATSSSGASDPFAGYPIGEWVDMGDWFFYIYDGPDLRKVYPTDHSFWMDKVAILQEKYPDSVVNWSGSIYYKDMTVWFVEMGADSQGFINAIRALGY